MGRGRKPKRYAFAGERRTLKEWAAVLGVTVVALRWRWVRRTPRELARKRACSRRHYRACKRAGVCAAYGCGRPVSRAAPAAYCPECVVKVNRKTRQAKRDARARDAAASAAA